MQKKREENPGHLLFSSDFLDTTPEVQSVKEKTGKLCFVKIKNSSVKNTVKRIEKRSHRQLKIFVNHILDKGLISRII